MSNKTLSACAPNKLTFPAPLVIVDCLLESFGREKSRDKIDLLKQHMVHDVPESAFEDSHLIGFTHHKEKLKEYYDCIYAVGDALLAGEPYTGKTLEYVLSLMDIRNRVVHGNEPLAYKVVRKCVLEGSLTYTEVGKELGMAQANVSRAMKKFRECEDKIKLAAEVILSVYDK